MADEPKTIAEGGGTPTPEPAPTPAPAPTPTPAPTPAPTPTPTPAPTPTPTPAPELTWPSAGFPPDWRVRWVSGITDEKARKTAETLLERQASPTAVIEKMLNQEKALSQRSGVRKPGENATADEVAAWRREAGIPESPDKYDIKLPEGKELGDDDKKVFKGFAERLHKAGASNDVMNEALAWYLDDSEAQFSSLVETDDRFRQESEAALRTKWGADFARNINAIGLMFADAPKGLGDALLNGRLADGRKIGDTPEMVEFLTKLSLESNPIATLMPTGGATNTSVETQIAEIEKVMRTDNSKYWHDPDMQKRYGELLAARENMKKRAA